MSLGEGVSVIAIGGDLRRLAANRRGLAATLAVLGLLGAPALAEACDPLPASMRFRTATQVVYGHVALLKPDARVHGRYRATIRVSRVYKGRRVALLRVTGSVNGEVPNGTGVLAGCGTGKLIEGQRIALMLFGKDRPYELTLPTLSTLTELTRLSGGRFTRPS